jgi:hypothetical protein
MGERLCTEEGLMKFDRGVFSALQFGVALLSLLVPQLGFAYDHPLTDEAVRAGYFSGQDLDRSNEFFARYTEALPVPHSGPQVAELVQKNHMAATGVSAQLLYASDPDGYSWVIGADVFVEFTVAGVESDSVDVEVVPPGGVGVRASFDLGRLT